MTKQYMNFEVFMSFLIKISCWQKKNWASISLKRPNKSGSRSWLLSLIICRAHGKGEVCGYHFVLSYLRFLLLVVFFLVKVCTCKRERRKEYP